jgi:hypothetical protein
MDPSEDALYMRISDLELPDNSFLTIEPARQEGGWYAVVSLLESGSYEVEYRDHRRNEHRVEQELDLADLSKDLIIWLRNAALRDRG